MANLHSPDSYFADAYQHRRDITDSYLALGDIPNLVGVSAGDELGIIQEVRRLLQQDAGGILKISDIAAVFREKARALYHGDMIAAIDGTDAVSPLRFVSDTIYATGVVAVTPRSKQRPRARVTRTRAASYTATQNLSKPWHEIIIEWSEYLRGAREDEMSWVNTFREYEERELANEWLQGDEKRIVLIDGPVLTQNLLSQNTARTLLGSIITTKRAIGFIKDLSANPLLAAIGCALEPGEAFVLAEWSNLLSQRFHRGQEAISSWIDATANNVVRAIYKVNQKAYGLECMQDQVQLAFSILEHDPGGSADHDIPMLLQIADAHVRTQFNGASARDEVLARYSLRDPSRFVELTDERRLR